MSSDHSSAFAMFTQLIRLAHMESSECSCIFKVDVNLLPLVQFSWQKADPLQAFIDRKDLLSYP
jgi:hypothetical protein